MMGLEVKLKRTQSAPTTRKNSTTLQARSLKRVDFPSDWISHNIGYDSLKSHLKEFEERKKSCQGKSEDTELDTWEHSFVIRLNGETSKINIFYEERHNECVEGLRQIETDISSLCSRKSIDCIQSWHEFLNRYCEGIKVLESGQTNPAEFISFMEAQLIKMAEKPINQTMLNTLKRLVLIHKLSLQLRKYALFNLSEFKKLLKKHDKKARVSISTEWMQKLQQERFCVYDSFEKTVAITKSLIRSQTPIVDDFSCAICLDLLCKPVTIRCGHKFCKDCLIMVSSSNYNFCPMCRTEQELHPSNYVEDKQLKVYLKQYFPLEYKTKKKEHKTAQRKARCHIL